MSDSDRANLDRLRAQPRRRGEASFFWYEPQFARNAVKVLPGEYFVHDQDLLVTTTLGSCIATCLWDRYAKVGGMNHFLLPEAMGSESRGHAGGRYGAFAMEQLINELFKLGATRSGLEAKVFGGGNVVAGISQTQVGERNTAFALDYLKTERIPVVAKHVLDYCPRKVCFLPASGKAMVKRLAMTHNASVAAQERGAAALAPTLASGTIDLF